MSEVDEKYLPEQVKSYNEIGKEVVDLVKTGGDIKQAIDLGRRLEFNNRKIFTDLDKETNRDS